MTTRRRLDEYLGFGRGHDGKRFARNGAREYPVSPLLNTVVCGDCRDVLDRLPERPVDLVFTSPPYFNARPELGCFEDYEEYLVFLKSVIEKVGRVLVPGRFFVLNIAPVIVPSERPAMSRRGSPCRSILIVSSSRVGTNSSKTSSGSSPRGLGG